MNETNMMLSKILEAVQILQAESSVNRLEFAKIHGKLDGLTDRMDGLESKMTELETRMDGLESKMTKLETRMDGLESRIDSLESRVSQVETQMHNRFDQIETNIARLKIGQKRLSEKIFEQDMEISILREA